MNISQSSAISCTGCGLCQAVCPNGAISMHIDDLGFYNPILNVDECNHCGLCAKNCTKYMEPSNCGIDRNHIYSAWSIDKKIRLKSASGGIGYILSLWALEHDYSVWGAVYDSEKMCVRHSKALNKQELSEFQGSKYLQSDTTELMKELADKTRDKKIFVFGTPCQIRAIREYINKVSKKNVILVDVFCRGVPSYQLWKLYIKRIQQENGISRQFACKFRDKNYGWHSCQMTISDGKNNYTCPAHDDWYYRIYTSGLAFRDSCYECDLKLENTYSDIRIGDFWGEKYEHDEEGVSILIANTQIGKEIIQNINDCIEMHEASFLDVQRAQKYIYNSRTAKIDRMREMLNMNNSFEDIYRKLIRAPLYKRIAIKLYMSMPKRIRLMLKRMLIRG